MAKYLDNDGLLYFWQKIKNAFAAKEDAVKTITRSGTTFTATRADGTTFTFTQQDNTVAKTTTTPKANGTAAIGSETKYAAGDHVHPLQTTVSGNAGTATRLKTPRKLDGYMFDGSYGFNRYAVCDTDAGTAAKTVSMSALVEGGEAVAIIAVDVSATTGAGSRIAVKFTNGNTAANPTLAISGGDAKAIYYDGAAVGTSVIKAGGIYELVYDGLHWCIVGAAYEHPSHTEHTTSAIYKFKNDSSGHVTEATAATASDVKTLLGNTAVNRATGDADGNAIKTTYAKLAGPTFTGTPKAPTAAAGTNTTQIATTAFVTTAVNNAVSGLYKYKGSVANEAALPTSGQTTGDVYNIEAASTYGAAGANVAWNGSAWDSLGEIFSIDNITNTEIDTIVAS